MTKQALLAACAAAALAIGSAALHAQDKTKEKGEAATGQQGKTGQTESGVKAGGTQVPGSTTKSGGATPDKTGKGEAATGQQGKTGQTESGVKAGGTQVPGSTTKSGAAKTDPKADKGKSGESATGQQGKTGQTESGVKADTKK